MNQELTSAWTFQYRASLYVLGKGLQSKYTASQNTDIGNKIAGMCGSNHKGSVWYSSKWAAIHLLTLESISYFHMGQNETVEPYTHPLTLQPLSYPGPPALHTILHLQVSTILILVVRSVFEHHMVHFDLPC